MYKKPIKGPFKNDVTRVREDGVPKISDKKWHRGRKVHANSDIATKKIYVQVFIFRLILLNAAADELWLPFQSGCRFKHWPESARGI